MLLASADIEKIAEVSTAVMKKTEEFATRGLETMLVCEEARIDFCAAGACSLFRCCEHWRDTAHDMAGLLTSLWCASLGAEWGTRPRP